MEYVALEDMLDFKLEYRVSNQHVYDAIGHVYARYLLEITARAEPNFFKEPMVLINSPEINLLRSSVTLPALFFESLRAYESIYERKGRREWISKHYFKGVKQNDEGTSSGIDDLEGGHFYKQVFSGIKLNADAEAAAAALTAAALLQAERELLTADQALTNAQSASDAAKAVVAEITEAQRQALEALFPGG